MDITKKFAESIIRGFEGKSVGNKITLGVTSPLWVTGLLVSGTVEGVVDIGKGAVSAVGNVTGTVGDCTFKKLNQLEKMRAAVNHKGAEIMVKFEGDIYKFDSAVDLIKSKTLSEGQENVLLENMAKAIAKAK